MKEDKVRREEQAPAAPRIRHGSIHGQNVIQAQFAVFG